MSKMQKEMNKIFDATQKELDQEVQNSKHMVSESAKQLMKIKKSSTIDTVASTDSKPSSSVPEKSIQATQSKIFDVDDWEIEYDE